MSDKPKKTAEQEVKSNSLLEILMELNRHIEKLECIGGTGVVGSVCDAIRQRDKLLELASHPQITISNDKVSLQGSQKGSE